MITSTLLEILGDRRICMHGPTFVGLRNRILANLDSGYREHADRVTELQAFVKFSAGTPVSVTDFMGDAQRIKYWEDLNDNDTIVNVVRLTGAMTRGGGDCSYGSIDLRDRLIAAANIKQTVAHIIYGRTPGGMASTLRDFRAAINYCHSKGQKVYFYCDGDVASGGAFTACITDGIYASNPDDEIGSLGMYCAFFSMKDGAKNSVTSEQYHEYYASASPDKNAWYRKAAEGDMSLVEKEVNNDLAQLLANLKKDRPQVKDAQLTGAMYRMGDVEGSLIDGFCSLMELAQMALDEWKKRGGTVLPAKETASPISSQSGAGGKSTVQSDKSLNDKTMNKTYVNVAQFIGEQPMNSDNEGVLSLQPYQADALEEKLNAHTLATEQMIAENNSLRMSIQGLAEQLVSVQAELKNAKDELVAANGDAEVLKPKVAELEEALASAQTELTNVQAQLAASEEARNTAQNTLEEQTARMVHQEQIITDLRAEVVELNNGASASGTAGEGIQTNGMTGEAPRMEAAPTWDVNLSATENMKRMDEYKRHLTRMSNRS